MFPKNTGDEREVMWVKKALSVMLACAVISMSAPAAFAEEYSVYDSLKSESVTVEANVNKDGLYGSGDRMVRVRDGKVSPYTGFAKTKKGTYCYKDGIKWTGWYKKGGKWYYFDPLNDGLKAVKTAKTSLGTYYLDGNGAWNGKYSGSVKRPADFGYSFRFGGGESTEYFFSTKDGILSRDAYIDGVGTEKKIKISARDMQIIYDAFKSSGAENFDAEYAEDTVGIQFDTSIDVPSFSIEWYSGKECIDSVGCSSIIFYNDYYTASEEVRKLAGLVRFSRMYLESRAEYKEIIAEENAYAEAHKYAEVPYDELTRVKISAGDIYKFRGHSSPSGGRAMLITSKAEMNELISQLEKEGVSKNSKLIGRLSSYSKEYFKDNAVIFGDGNAYSGSVKIDDPKIYTGYGNIYLNVNLKYPEMFTDDCCYYAAVAEADKKTLGCDNSEVNVIWRSDTITNYETE